jgi:hypothetical protein
VLDFSVVVSAWVPLLFPQLNSVSGLRAVRALRPLRTINRLPGMRKQVNVLLSSLSALGDVLMLIAFFIVVAGVRIQPLSHSARPLSVHAVCSSHSHSAHPPVACSVQCTH